MNHVCNSKSTILPGKDCTVSQNGSWSSRNFQLLKKHTDAHSSFYFRVRWDFLKAFIPENQHFIIFGDSFTYQLWQDEELSTVVQIAWFVSTILKHFWCLRKTKERNEMEWVKLQVDPFTNRKFGIPLNKSYSFHIPQSFRAEKIWNYLHGLKMAQKLVFGFLLSNPEASNPD